MIYVILCAPDLDLSRGLIVYPNPDKPELKIED